MRNIMLTVEYDGTNYCGWQTQPNATSVQEMMEGALAQMLGEPVRLHASGRTDAGVHARGMVACFQTEKTMPVRAFREGLNTLLPRDIAVREAREMPLDFHARFNALGKHYRYTFLLDEIRSPLTRLTAWRLKGKLDVEAVRQACAEFVGEHDFAAFRASNCTAKTTVRTIYSMELTRDGNFIYLDVRGSGFLKNMIRVIAGTLVEVGQGRRTAEDIRQLLKDGDRKASGMTAPPQGLCLMEVFYSEDLMG